MELKPALPGVAERVSDFYNQFPYPQPIDNLDNYRRIWDNRQRRRADYHLFWPAEHYRENKSILVAGCGTSQAAKHALRWPEAQVIGIDFSATSIRCTEELKQKYDLKGLQLYQIPIERVADLGTSFDQIVCTGVLHHLADPDIGLRALRSVLKPSGAMHLMVYAPYGRTGVYMMQEFCKRVGIAANDQNISALVHALKALPRGHPLGNLLQEAPDFRHEAALADALLNPQDRAYSVPELLRFIESAGLTFGRWVRQAPYTHQCGVTARIPQAHRISKLSLAEQHATAELFRGTMARHSLIVYRNDHPDRLQPFSFAGDYWPGYVPIRMSGTVCVQEGLPPGAAAVLINRGHTFRDLFMPINPTELRLFEAIDGSSSISSLLDRRSPTGKNKFHPDLELARSFFERLWLYDQVVFDTSQRRNLGSAGAKR